MPAASRALAVELVATRRGKAVTVARATVRLAAGGAQRIRWRVPAATVERLAAGRYTLLVGAGKDARSIGRDRLGQALELRRSR